MAFKLRVKNFQSIQDSELDIHQLTVITGTNSAGKSAVVRAMKGMFENSPVKNYIRKGEDFFEVEFSADDGSSVKWVKGKNHNDYIINGDEKENVSRGAPEDISTIGIVPVEVSTKKTFWPQFASQSDSVYFVLDEPGTTLAEVVVSDVEKVTNLNLALSASERQKREFRAEEKIRRKDVESVQEKISSLSGIRELSQRAEVFKKNLKESEHKRESLSKVVSIQSKMETLQKEKERLSTLGTLRFPEMEKVQECMDSLKKLAVLFHKMKKNREEIGRLSSLGECVFPSHFPSTDELKVARSLFERMASLESQIRETQKVQGGMEDDLSENEGAISSLLAELKICPMCSQDLTKELFIL